MDAKTLKNIVRKSHELQFNGKDFQQAAFDLLCDQNFSDDELHEVQSMPNPGCECGFCANAPWID